MIDTTKLKKFQGMSVSFVETQTVKEGVECDIYSFRNDASRDLAIVRVRAGFKTPLQKVLLGTKTIEGYSAGSGVLTVTSTQGLVSVYNFPNNDAKEVIVLVGEVMQWHAIDDLVFYEICEPPYEDGRFEDLIADNDV